jgi:HAE1 family hydrophobic/amphiphilic exporter-1
VGTELGQPEFQIEIDRERAASYGLEPQRIARAIETYMRGTEATQFIDFDRRVPVIVRLPEQARRSLATLGTLSVDGVPVRELVHVTEATGPVEIRRLDQSRYVPVYADVSDGGIDRAVADIRVATAGLAAPADTRVEIGGENEEMQRSFRHLALAFLLAVILVYMILAAEFESFVHPFTVLLSIPFALIGAVLALWLAGEGVNTISLIGVIILTGIVDNNAVVMLDLIGQLRAQGYATRDALLEAAQARLRPILMTTLTTMLAILPMALALGAGGALQAPLGIAVLGGLFSATALTLIALPVGYELVEGLRERVRGGLAPAAGQSAATHATTPAPGGAASTAPAGGGPPAADARASSDRRRSGDIGPAEGSGLA